MAKHPKLLGTSKKIVKSKSIGVFSRVLYLAPASESGRNVCRFSTAGCRAACLGHSAGMMNMTTHKAARIRKTRLLFSSHDAFFDALHHDINATRRAADRAGMIPAVRPNGSSDLPWERMRDRDGATIFEAHPDIKFYDYTKDPTRALASLAPTWPANYQLTLSRSGENDAACVAHLRAGGRVAVVFGGPLPSTWEGFPVIDGDTHDFRFDEGQGVVIGLTPKGKARRDASGFVLWSE